MNSNVSQATKDLLKTRTEIRGKVKEMLKGVTVPANHARIEPYYTVRTYRGKRQHVVGYSWSRPCSTYHGNVYDRVLGAGETADEALAKMKETIAATTKGATT
jgi:hypothetical protein